MTSLGRVIVFAADLPRMQAFYTAIVGAPNVIDPGWIVFEQARFALHAIRGAHAPPTGDAREDTAIKYVFVTDDLAAMRTTLEGLGAALRPTHTYGTRSYFDGVDPEGNVFQIANG